jgi:hypothetical protein
MKRLRIIVLSLTVAALLLVVPAHAQFDFGARGHIPFAFTVVNKTLPAGSYTIRAMDYHLVTGTMKISGLSNSESAFVLTRPVQKLGRWGKPMLVFRRYGDQYFLAQIWTGESTGCEVPKSAKEGQVSLNQSEPELIYVAAK